MMKRPKQKYISTRRLTKINKPMEVDMAGLKVYDENGDVIFDDSYRVFKILGETTLEWKGTDFNQPSHFQIPLSPGQKAFIMPVNIPLQNSYIPGFIDLDVDTGIISFVLGEPAKVIYGCW